MGSGISSATSLAVYLSTIKNEQAQVTKYVASNRMVAATVSAFTSAAATLTTPDAVLGNYRALQVLTGAYNLNGQINQTAVLRDLMTQSADSTTSLVSQTGNTDYLHFARATSDRSVQTASLGSAGTMSLVASGTAASSLTMQNTAWSLASTAQTKAAPGVQWSFLLNDGTAGASIASALEAAAASANSSASYSISLSGTVTASGGAPIVTTSKDNAGNMVYNMALATDSAGNVIKKATIVSVKVTAGDTSANSTAQLTALKTAIGAAGFDVSLSGDNRLQIVNPASNGLNSLALSYGNAIATATNKTLVSGTQLALGDAGKMLSAGQVLTDGSTAIGTVRSVDSFGNVTLAAVTSTPISAGDTIEVATGLGFANVGTRVTATSASAAGSTVIALGTGGLGLLPGQIMTSDGVTIGTVGSVDKNGTVTLLAPATRAVSGLTPLVVLPAITGGTTPALDDQGNVSSIVSNYETNSYESKLGAQYTGMDNALYYTRTMGGITSINALMANAKLLSVVTTAMGMGNWFGALDYGQQVTILTAKVDLKTMTTPAGIRRTAEQYLIAKAATVSSAPTGLAALFAGSASSDTSLLSMINGAPSISSQSTTMTDPILGLFT